MDCEGFGRERTEPRQDYKPFLSKNRIEIFAPECLVDVIVDTMMLVAHSGQHGNGKVYITEILEGGRISTRELDADLG